MRENSVEYKIANIQKNRIKVFKYINIIIMEIYTLALVKCLSQYNPKNDHPQQFTFLGLYLAKLSSVPSISKQ